MRSSRSAPVLLIVFGMLIGLIAISGFGAMHRARETYRAVSILTEHYRHTDRVLHSIASGIYMAGLVARDYLLDPSNVHAAEYRAQLVAERSAMELEFALENTATEESYPLLLVPSDSFPIPSTGTVSRSGLHVRHSAFRLDWAPLIHSVLDDLSRQSPVAQISAKFHNALA